MNGTPTHDFYPLALGVLAVWRLTHLLSEEDGPWDVILRLRVRLGQGFLGQLMDCFFCTSLWVAAPLAVLLGTDPSSMVTLWLALSGGACLLQRMTAPRQEPAAFWTEDAPLDSDHASSSERK